MKSLSQITAFVTLASLAQAQAPADAPAYKETVKLFQTNIEGKWTEVVLRKKMIDITFIPEGATDNTWVDYWMDGHYSTEIRSNGLIFFELSMTLHVPKFVDNYYYLIWLSLYNDYLTNLKADGNQYYETYTCTI
jgi:hypothetical protein